MCPPRRPKAPPLPPPRPVAPAPEQTAQTLKVGADKGQGVKLKRKAKPTGTDTLRIPVTMSSDLRY